MLNPAFLLVISADQQQQVTGGGGDVRGKPGYFVLETLAGYVSAQVGNGGA